jgi:chemotaxis protein CheX
MSTHRRIRSQAGASCHSSSTAEIPIPRDETEDSVMPTIQVDYINPFITSLEDTFGTMLSCKIHRKGLEIKDNNIALYPVSGIIGLSGKAVGTVVLTLSSQLAIAAASTLLMEEMKEVDNDVLDAVGELTNMVTGGAKAKLEEYRLQMSLPNVLHAQQCNIHFPANAHPITIPFQSERGPLALEVGFSFPG